MMEPVAFTVAYGLREYLSFVHDYGAWRQATEVHKVRATSTPPRLGGWLYLMATVYLLAPPIFLFKNRRVGECTFTADERALVRRNKTGSTEMPWSEVLRVHRLSQAYLVEKAEGAMPLPYRCFTQAQRHAFESILRENNVPAAGDACCIWTPPASASASD